MPSWDELQGGTEVPGLSQRPAPAAGHAPIGQLGHPKGQARQVALVKPRVSRRKLTASTRLTGYQREVTLLPAIMPEHANLHSRADHILNVCPIHRSQACRHPKSSSPTALRKAVSMLRYGHTTTTTSTAVLS